MATYDYIHKASGGNFKPGYNCIYAKFDATDQNLAANDVVRLAKLPDNAILTHSFYRMPTTSTSTATVDLGTTYDGSGQEIAAGWDIDSALPEWTVGVIRPDTSDGNFDAIEITDADSYLTFEALGAAISDGVFEVMVGFIMFPPQTTPVSAAAVTA
jgi:hypothetical protein